MYTTIKEEKFNRGEDNFTSVSKEKCIFGIIYAKLFFAVVEKHKKIYALHSWLVVDGISLQFFLLLSY